MERLTRFEEHRYVGDKRNQVVHDIDACQEPDHIHALMKAETFTCFAPDTLAEARNRGYKRVCGVCTAATAAVN